MEPFSFLDLAALVFVNVPMITMIVTVMASSMAKDYFRSIFLWTAFVLLI